MVGNKLQLQRKAKYYFYQVQMKMYVLGLKACDFVVWTRNGIKCVEIVFDPQFIIDVRKAFGILDWSSFAIISGPADDKKCNQSEPVDDKKSNQSEPADENKNQAEPAEGKKNCNQSQAADEKKEPIRTC